MTAADGGVRRCCPADVGGGVRRGQDGREDPFPSAVAGPPDPPLVRGLGGPEFVRQVSPRRAGAVLPRDGLPHPPVVGPPAATDRIRRHQRLDPVPHRITDQQPYRHIRHIRSAEQPNKETRSRRHRRSPEARGCRILGLPAREYSRGSSPLVPAGRLRPPDLSWRGGRGDCTSWMCMRPGLQRQGARHVAQQQRRRLGELRISGEQ